MTTLGIDVSQYQGLVDWPRVARWRGPAGERVEFAIARATIGNTKTDPQFARNWKGIGDVNIVRGAYHAADPDTAHERDPLEEAHNFLAQVHAEGFRRGADFLALDIERNGIAKGAPFVSWVLDFLDAVSDATGQLCWVYTGGSFFQANAGSPPSATLARLGEHPMWIAAYVRDPERYLAMMPAWKAWDIHQRSGDQAPAGETILHVDGIAANVDRNVFRGSLLELRARIAATVYRRETQPVQPDGPAHPLGVETRAERDAADIRIARVTPEATTKPETPNSRRGGGDDGSGGDAA